MPAPAMPDRRGIPSDRGSGRPEQQPETERRDLRCQAFDLIAAQRRLLEQALAYNTYLHEHVAQCEPSRDPSCGASQGLDAPLLAPVREAESECWKLSDYHSLGDSPEIPDSFSRFDPFGRHLPQHLSPSAAPQILASEPSSAQNLASSVTSSRSVSDKRTWGKRESARKSVEEFYDAKNASDEVETKYKEEGIWVDVATAAWFKNLTLAVTLLSVIWIAIDTDYNKATISLDAPPIFQIVDNFVCLFFLFELTVRFQAYAEKADAFRDHLFVFDGVLVLMNMWELWGQSLLFVMMSDRATHGKASVSSPVFRIIRIARLMRVLRVSRVFHSVPELFILVKAMIMALRSVAVTLALLLGVTYTFAIFLTDTLSTSAIGHGRFDSVPTSMNFLLLQVICGFDSDFITSLYDAGSWGSYFAMLLFLLLGLLTIMNMLVGVLVDVVATASDSEFEAQAQDKLRLHLAHLVALTDQDGDNSVNRDEFLDMFSDPEAMECLDDVGVNVLQLLEHSEYVFRDQDTMSLKQFVGTVMQFRGQSSVNVRDLMNLKFFVSEELERLQLKVLERLDDARMAPAVKAGAVREL